MLKLLAFSLMLSLSLFSADKIEIYTSNMTSKGQIVEASQGVTIIYKNYIITADRALYNKENGDLELFDNIRVNRGIKYKLLGHYAKLNIAKKENFFKPFYMINKKTELWMSADNGKTKDTLFNIHKGTLSGCDPFHPKWKIEFSSLDYDNDDKWINVYNARFYIGDIPILYTPYFGYSTNTTRRTGLLMPSFGVSSSEGVYYAQALYIAEQNWWDMEITPQIRTLRGKGIYQTLRFTNSSVSHGTLTAGYFKEDDNYFQKKNLQNQAHYGFNLKYDNSDFINNVFGTDLKGQSAIYTDINYMNDVDYINLATDDALNTSTTTQILSRVNLFYNTDKHYIGSYFKYYRNLTYTPQQQKQLLQKLPTLQYHYYLNTLLKNHLLYNVDVQVNNSSRQDGKTAVQTNIKLPITLYTTLFDEYLNLSYTSDIYFQHSSFSGSDKTALPGQVAPLSLNLQDGYYVDNRHSLFLSTQLTKGYETVSHVVSLGVRYNQPGEEFREGYYNDNKNCQLTSNAAECEFYNISSVHKEAQLEFTQYLYDANVSQILYQRIAQSITFTNNNQSYSELENELDYSITSYLSFYNNMFYNYKKNLLSKAFNKITLNTHGVSTTLSHLYQDSFKKKVNATDKEQYTSYITSTFSYDYNSHYSFEALFNYDMQKDELKSRGVGFLYKSKCLDFGLKYQENRRPITANSGNSFIEDKFVFINLVLKPIMQNSKNSLFTYQLPN